MQFYKNHKEHQTKPKASILVSQEKQFNADSSYDIDTLYESLFDEIIHTP